jgi:hypothetical protein
MGEHIAAQSGATAMEGGTSFRRPTRKHVKDELEDNSRKALIWRRLLAPRQTPGGI